jgi:hypothetical protein
MVVKRRSSVGDLAGQLGLLSNSMMEILAGVGGLDGGDGEKGMEE